MVNKVILVGNVGADPEVRTLENGNKTARVRLATTERFFRRETNETTEHTEWHTIVFWRGLADVVDRFVRKGSQIYVEGRLRTREWTDQSGNKRYSTEIQGDDMKLLGRRSDGQQGNQPQGGYQQGGGQQGSYQQGGYQQQSGGYQQGGYNNRPAQPNQPAPQQPQEYNQPDQQPSNDIDDLPF